MQPWAAISAWGTAEMNYSGASIKGPLDAFSDDQPQPDTITPRQRARIERDRERGYSINVKQIVLAFAVEFVIIGLILTNNVATVAQLPDATTSKTIQALLFPIAMAMVELARVPLAIAVRTQNSWNIKFAALLGVFCAVAVTSVSLILIGNSTFNPRLEDTHKKDDVLMELKDKRAALVAQIRLADENVQQKRRDKDSADKATQGLITQPRELSLAKGQTITFDENSRLQLDPSAKILVEGEVKIQTPTISVPLTASPRAKSPTPTITNFTVFKSVPFEKGSIQTGWVFLTSAQKSPTSQYCYFTESAENSDVSLRIEVGTNEQMEPPKKLTAAFNQSAAFARCVWFKKEGR
jgi:hypothetical protein